MTREMLDAVLAAAHTKLDENAAVQLPEGQKITFYLARDGAALSVSRVVSIRLQGEVLTAEDDQAERFFVGLGDIYAASLSAEQDAAKRKAGFLR